MGMKFLKFLIFVVVSFFLIVLHAFVQAYVAYLNGDRTARQAKRLTLNPVRHFDFVGLLLIIFCRIGFTKPIPTNSYYFKHKRFGLLSVPISGLLVYILSAFFSVPLLFVCVKYLQPVMSSTVAGERGYELIYTIFHSVFTAGIGLFLFNLIPIYPLDGYNIVEGVFGCTNTFARWLRDYAKYVFLSVIITFYFADLFGLPSFLNPAYWYMEVLGGYIQQLFINIWLPLF
ncbi:MAG: site-2 protease family protein [Clostridiales bacterium]|nr:site-2 protease family protein [Clostridiales bacterium]